jgi:hypothetical protein
VIVDDHLAEVFVSRIVRFILCHLAGLNLVHVGDGGVIADVALPAAGELDVLCASAGVATKASASARMA